MQSSLLPLQKKYFKKPVVKKKGKKVKPYFVNLIKKVVNEDFIFSLCEYFLTSELVLYFRPLSKFFDHCMKRYLPIRLQQEAEFINAYLLENNPINQNYLKIVDT